MGAGRSDAQERSGEMKHIIIRYIGGAVEQTPPMSNEDADRIYDLLDGSMQESIKSPDRRCLAKAEFDGGVKFTVRTDQIQMLMTEPNEEWKDTRE